MRLSKRAELISPSLTLGISAKAAEMRKAGIDVVDLGAGQPDFDTPMHIKVKAKEAIDKGYTRYTPTAGIEELRKAICRKLREKGLEYTPEEVVVSCGAKHSLFNIFLALIDEGDEVIIPSPYWVSYPEMVKIAGGKPVFVETREENGFKMSAEQLRKSVTEKTKALILNSPCNPTGAVYGREELRAISEVVVENGIYCISDEVYEKFVYDGEHVSIASFAGMKELTIVVNAVSKTYCMTGWRIGYAAGPREIMSAISRIQDHTTSNPTSISQYAALEAIVGTQEQVEEMVKIFRERRDFVWRRLNEMGLRCHKPEGAFYVFPRISQYFAGSIRSSVDFSRKLLEEQAVAVVPGIAFGSDEHIRISYAASMEELEKGMDRLEKFLRYLTATEK